PPLVLRLPTGDALVATKRPTCRRRGPPRRNSTPTAALLSTATRCCGRSVLEVATPLSVAQAFLRALPTSTPPGRKRRRFMSAITAKPLKRCTPSTPQLTSVRQSLPG